VPLFKGLQGSLSKGSYLHQNVKGNYQSERIK
jgi:hypothetical protein